jgi:hypothetical protein
MDNKKQPVPDTTITRDLSKLSAPTGNIYETVIIIAKRANQIATEVKKELNSRLEEFSILPTPLRKLSKTVNRLRYPVSMNVSPSPPW